MDFILNAILFLIVSQVRVDVAEGLTVNADIQSTILFQCAPGKCPKSMCKKLSCYFHVIEVSDHYLKIFKTTPIEAECECVSEKND